MAACSAAPVAILRDARKSALLRMRSEFASYALSSSSLPRILRIKILQVRRALALLGRHQKPVGAAHIGVLAELDVVVVLGADRLDPDGITDAVVVFRDRPRPRQGIVDGGDFVVEHVGLVLVLVEALMDDGLAIGVQRNAA